MSEVAVRREVYDRVCDAVYALGHFTPDLPLKAIAARMGCSDGALRDLVNPQRKPTCDGDHIVALTRASRNYVVVRTICHLVGGSFVLRATGAAHEADLLEALGEVLREVGEDAEAIGRALAENGRLDAHEVPSILREIDETTERLATLRDVVASRRAPSPVLGRSLHGAVQ